jgi:hypothetical protein
MEGLFPLNRMVAGGRIFGREGKGLPSTTFLDRGNGNASAHPSAAVALGMGL